MNPTTYKLYKAVCSGVTGLSLQGRNFFQKTTVGRFIEYADYLVYTRAPRLTYLDTFAPAYTPKKVQHSAPIVLTLAGVVLVAEIYATIQAKQNAEEHFVKVRQ